MDDSFRRSMAAAPVRIRQLERGLLQGWRAVADKGARQRIFDHFADDVDMERLIIDSTIIWKIDKRLLCDLITGAATACVGVCAALMYPVCQRAAHTRPELTLWSVLVDGRQVQIG